MVREVLFQMFVPFQEIIENDKKKKLFMLKMLIVQNNSLHEV